MKTLTEELIENGIAFQRNGKYSINSFRLSEKYLTQHNLEHLLYALNPVELFEKLKSENSILIREHASYQWESVCRVCSKQTKFVTWYFGYKKYCSKECEWGVRLKSINSKTQEEMDVIDAKRKKTKFDRYGDENYNNVEQIVKTQNELYGGTFNLLKAKQTKLEKYGDENYNNPVKQQETSQENSLKKYGVRHYTQLGDYTTNLYKSKDYILPSGEIIKYQGYENKLLDELFLEYKEDEIITSRKDIPPIWYIGTDNKEHRYFPDAYVPSTNTIYEVKSDYTLNLDLETNNLKFQAVKDAGYNFVLKVY